MLMRQELRQKGVHENIIDLVLDETFTEFREQDLVADLVEKRKARLPADRKKGAKRLSDFLIRRGFSWDVIKPFIDDFLNKSD